MKYTKIYIYFGFKLFLLVMGWIIFYQLKLMKHYTEYMNPSGQADSAYGQVIFSVSILLIAIFLIISVLTWKEFLRLDSKKVTSAENKLGTQSSEYQSDNTSPKDKIHNKKGYYEKPSDLTRQKLLRYFEKEIFSQTEKSRKQTGEKILSCISRIYEITQAEIFLKEKTAEKETIFKLLATYAIHLPEAEPVQFDLGEGLIGQVAQSGKHIYIDKLPEGFLTVKSGLGQSDPGYLLILPWKDKNSETFAVLELASFKPFCQQDIELLESFSENFKLRFLSWLKKAKNA